MEEDNSLTFSAVVYNVMLAFSHTFELYHPNK